MLTGIPCTLMRGGTSKGLYFNAADLPPDRELRDRVLLAAMGSPDARQIDGAGGAHPLTSKVAVISRSAHPGADVDYLFLQVVVDRAEVSDSQNCGNILAGVGPWAIENGLVPVAGPTTTVRIHMVNTGSLAVAHVPTPHGAVEYEGEARIDGVPGTAAPIALEFLDVAGSSSGSLLPTGAVTDTFEGIEVTCIDNGMPVIIVRAADLGVTGAESPAQLEANAALVARVERMRLSLGPRMNLGDVTRKTVPKISLVSAPRHGGSIGTATFIPHRVHEAIGVLGAVSVATACAIPGSVAAQVAQRRDNARRIEVEHPSGFFTVDVEVERGDSFVVRGAALLRTARKILRGEVFVPGAVWSHA
ncbi:MAG TPA: 4-oxalomesaconate tautomerase [Steroidobacteraceae bacterium]|nr:4-oxalomesaconate tautomerase [Steroidobacteraceae bacterium]